MENDLVKITIITVVYNNSIELKTTIQNIIDQTYTNIEYIVVDGKSTDGTLNIINKYSDHIHVWTSEEDEGLYDAMNKGMALATGDYIVFMNAGDTFAKKETLSNVAEEIVANEFPDFVYGDLIEIPFNGKSYLRVSRSTEAKKIGMFTCHQSMYYKNQVIKDYNLSYDLKFKIASDYNFTCKFLNVSKRNFHISSPLCKFELGGISTENWYKYLVENHETRKTVLKMSFMQGLFIHYAQVVWHIVKFKVPIIHRLIRYRNISDEN